MTTTPSTNNHDMSNAAYAVPARITTDADYTITYRNEHGFLSMVALPDYTMMRARLSRIEANGGVILDYSVPTIHADLLTTTGTDAAGFTATTSKRAHVTHKSTATGRALTIARKIARAAKRA